MWISRALENRIQAAAASRPAVVITGARQTGKTSLLRRLFPSHAFVSLDLPSEAERAERDSSTFLRHYGTPLIVDEVQYAPKLFRHLKIAIDENRGVNGLFLLTGSQKFSLMKEVSDSLAGRVELLELETLSALELGELSSTISIEEMIVRGGYPELYTNLGIEHSSFYRSYISTYLERDVRQILNVSDLRDFERFLRAAALRSGQLLNKAELARDVGITPATANDWLSVLQASNQIHLLEPWFTNRTKSLVKTPKLYISDTGILCALLNINSAAELAVSPYRGAIWETFVFAELRKRQESMRGTRAINFWRDKTNEVDFVVDQGGRVGLIEAKWTESTALSDLKGIEAFSRKYQKGDIQSASVICRTPNDYPLSNGVVARSIRSKELSI